MSTIQLKRKLTGAVAAPPVSAAGEPMFSVPGFTGGGPNSLWIGDGTTAVPLVDNTRQVEIAGAQTITGPKTFGAGATLSITDTPTTALHAANKAYVDTAVTGVAFTWGTGLTETTPGTVDLDQATQVAAGGGMIATTALIAAGGSDTTLVSPLGLRSQLGADAATLVTTARTVVPALNEMYNAIAALTGVVIYAGSYDATLSTATFNGQGGIAAGTGPLPAASAANHGSYVIVTVAGPGGVAPEPAGPIAIGDWLISDGAAWTRLAFNQAAVTAPNVALSPMIAGITSTHVQGALEQVLPLTGGVMTGAISFDTALGVEQITTAVSAAGAGTSLSLQAATGTTGPGGDISLSGGDSSATLGAGGGILLVGGSTYNAVGAAGNVHIEGGYGYKGAAGGVELAGGAAGNGILLGGAISLLGGTASTGATGGPINIQGGQGAVVGGLVTITGGSGVPDGPSGDVVITGGAPAGGTAGVGSAGNVILERAMPATINPGNILFRNLPTVATADPNAVWNNAGVLNIGAGAITAAGATFFDPLSFTGDGLSAATQITLATVDGGVF